MNWLKKIIVLFVVGVGLMGTAVAADQAPSHEQARPDFIVTLLGTGSPVPVIGRFSNSTLVQAGDVNLLFDAGRGVLMRLWQMGLSSGSLDATFLTHLHSDHTVGLPDLWLSGWIMNPAIRNPDTIRPFVIYGPGPIENRPGTKHLMTHIKKAYAADIWARQHDEKLPPQSLQLETHNLPVDANGVIFEKHGVKVTVFPVDHRQWAKPAFGYRVDYQGRSVTLSGDTIHQGPDSPMARAAQGTDVFIHEVFAGGPAFLDSKVGQLIKNHHTVPQDVGREFAHAQPRLAVYSHLVTAAFKRHAMPTPETITKQTRETYKGRLLVGEDLTSIIIGEDEITVQKPRMGQLPVAPAHQTGPYNG